MEIINSHADKIELFIPSPEKNGSTEVKLDKVLVEVRRVPDGFFITLSNEVE